jgi:hypothetical protein
MKFFKCLVIALTVFTYSCKDTAKEEVKSQDADLSNVFVFSVECLVNKTDNFALFYTEDGSINFGDKVMWKEVRGNETIQNVDFFLPKNVYPTQFRLDLGSSQEQDEVQIKSITFKYNEKKRTIKGLEMGAFFRADYTKCSFDYNTGIVKTLTKDGKKLGFSLYPHEAAQAVELPKLMK